MSILVPSDFIGKVAITQNDIDTVKLQVYIDELEVQYLDDLLGCELSTLLIADLALPITGEPTAQRFKDIFNKFCIDISGFVFSSPWHHEFFEFFVEHRQNRSRGIKEMLKGFIYYEYVRDQQQINSSIGITKSKGIASDLVSSVNNGIAFRYNDSIVDYWNIQFFINENLSVYSEYNGLRKQATGIV